MKSFSFSLIAQIPSYVLVRHLYFRFSLMYIYPWVNWILTWQKLIKWSSNGKSIFSLIQTRNCNNHFSFKKKTSFHPLGTQLPFEIHRVIKLLFDLYMYKFKIYIYIWNDFQMIFKHQNDFNYVTKTSERTTSYISFW